MKRNGPVYFGTLTVREDGGDGESEGDDGETVEIEEQQDGERVRVVDDGSVARRNEENAGDDGAADRRRRRELEHPREPVQIALHAHQLHRLLPPPPPTIAHISIIKRGRVSVLT